MHRKVCALRLAVQERGGISALGAQWQAVELPWPDQPLPLGSTTGRIDSAFVCEYPERPSFQIGRQTVIVPGNAPDTSQ